MKSEAYTSDNIDILAYLLNGMSQNAASNIREFIMLYSPIEFN